MIIDKKKKIIPLKENHVSSSKLLADEAVGVREGGEGDSTMAPLRSPLSEKCKEHHCGAGARRRPSAETSNSSSSFVHHVLCTPLLWQGVGRAKRGQCFNGKGREGKGCQFNSRKPTTPGRIRQAHRLGLCVWDWEEAWRFKANAS